jgi:hypothetical protein
MREVSIELDIAVIVLSESAFCDDIAVVCVSAVPRTFHRPSNEQTLWPSNEQTLCVGLWVGFLQCLLGEQSLQRTL